MSSQAWANMCHSMPLTIPALETLGALSMVIDTLKHKSHITISLCAALAKSDELVAAIEDYIGNYDELPFVGQLHGRSFEGRIISISYDHDMSEGEAGLNIEIFEEELFHASPLMNDVAKTFPGFGRTMWVSYS